MSKKSAIVEILGHDLDGHYVRYKVKTAGGAVKKLTDWDFQSKKEENLLAAYREKVTKQKDLPDAEFTVEKIITHRMVDGWPLYLVQWEGWPNAVSHSELWETDMKKCKSLLAEYKKKAELVKKTTKTPAKPKNSTSTSRSRKRAASPSPSPAPPAAIKKSRGSPAKSPKKPEIVVDKVPAEVDDDLEGIEESHEVVVEAPTPSRLMGMFSAVRSTFGF